MVALFDRARASFLRGEIDWQGDVIRVALIDTGLYTVNLGVHQYLSDIPAGARVAISPPLTLKTSLLGVADADDVTFPGVSGSTIEAFVIYQEVSPGDPSVNRLIGYVDSFTINGAGTPPLLPDGGDITIVWSNGPAKMFKL